MSKVYVGTIPRRSNWRMRVEENGERRKLDPRHDLRSHSVDGYAWGYQGSGPAQLALAILADHTGNNDAAKRMYLDFRDAVICRLNIDEGFQLTSDQVQAWIDKIGGLHDR